MKFDKRQLLLYIVTDRTWLGKNSLAESSLAAKVAKSIENGATFVQLREKDISFEEFVRIAKEIKEVCRRYQVPYVINDNIDVALLVDADGVHIGQSDETLVSARKRLGENKIIGVSAGSLEEARKARDGGADYIGVGAVFSTGTKKDAGFVPMETLKEIIKSVDIPVVAIGGINENNITELSGSGIAGVAVISAVFAKENIADATKTLYKLAEKVVDA